MNLPLAFLVSLLLACPVFQEQDSRLESRVFQTRSLKLITWHGGLPKFVSGPSVHIHYPACFIVLNRPEVRKEIETTSEQNLELDQWATSVISCEQRLIEQSFASPITEQQVQDFQLQLEDWQQELESILLPHQLKQLAQVRNRTIVRQVGLQSFLEQCMDDQSLDISAQQKRSIDQSIADLGKRFLNNELAAGAWQQWLEPFDPEQIKTIDSYCRSRQIQVYPLDLTMAQIDLALDQLPDDFEFGIDDDNSFSNLLKKKPEFHIGQDGKWTIAFGGSVEGMFAQQFIQTPGIRQTIGLTQKQVQALTDADMDARNAKSAAFGQIKEIKSTENRRATPPEIEALGESLRQIGKQHDQRVEETLTAAQLRQVRSIVSQTLERQYGLLALILYGDLGRRIDATPNQRAQLRKIAEQQQTRFRQQLIEWDNQLHQNVRKYLTNDQRRKLDELLGPKLTYVVPTLENLVPRK